MYHPHDAGAYEDGARDASERDGQKQCHSLLRPRARKPTYSTCSQMVRYKDTGKIQE